MTKRRRDRFERFKIIFPILLAGWIPSILTLIVSYTILRDTLEFRILRDRQTLIQLVGHLVAHDLNRSSSVIEYYQTLPEMVKNLSAPDPQLAQQCLNFLFNDPAPTEIYTLSLHDALPSGRSRSPAPCP